MKQQLVNDFLVHTLPGENRTKNLRVGDSIDHFLSVLIVIVVIKSCIRA